MAFTKRSDLIIPQILLEAIQGEFEGAQALYGTGAVIVDNSLPGNYRGGDTVTVPYFGIIGDAEDIVNEGDALTPEAISQDSETATVIHTGKAFATTVWARMAAATDPYPEAARQIRMVLERRWDKAAIDVATASLDSSYVNDVSAVGSGLITYDAMIDSRTKWGDQQEQILLMIVHSKVFGDMMKLKDSTGRPLLTFENMGPEGFTPAKFAGIPVKVSDKCKVIAGSPTKYESIILKRGAIAIWWNGSPYVGTDTDILAHVDVIATHHYFAAHRYRRTPGSTKPGVVKIITQ